jgi:predicted DCC family thiol-disulfide oxidoreductase YuxK
LIFVKAAIPERATEAARGWVLYDGECSRCTGAARRFQNLLHLHGFELATLQSPWVCRRLGTNAEEPFAEMKLLAVDGRVYGGADALVQIARKIWWAWPVFAFAQIPGAMVLLRVIYRRIAANRHCLNGACSIQKPLTHHHVTRVFFEMP